MWAPFIGRAGRRPQVAKPCHIDLIGVWMTGRCKNLSVSFADSSPIRGAIRAPVGAFFYEPRVVIRYPTPVGATTWGARYALRVSRSVVVILSLLPHSSIRRGRPVKASRYALRVSRSVVVILSLSRRNAASESEAACDRRPAGRPLGGPYDAPHQGEPFANH